MRILVKRLASVALATLLLGGGASAQVATCKKFAGDTDVSCANCAWYNPFSKKNVYTTQYHIVCSDGTDAWTSSTRSGACGDC